MPRRLPWVSSVSPPAISPSHLRSSLKSANIQPTNTTTTSTLTSRTKTRTKLYIATESRTTMPRSDAPPSESWCSTTPRPSQCHYQNQNRRTRQSPRRRVSGVYAAQRMMTASALRVTTVRGGVMPPVSVSSRARCRRNGDVGSAYLGP